MAINPINCIKPEYSSAVVQTQKNTAADKKDNTGMTSSASFNGFFSDMLPGVFTDKYKFSSAQEKSMYKELAESLQGKDKTNFDILYTTGRLQNRSSNDGTSTLQNLYNIYKKPRIEGLDNKKLFSETIERLANPFIINQKFGTIPTQTAANVLVEKAKNKTQNLPPNEPKTLDDMKIKNSASCVAASIEFSLADKKPAEFARFVEGLSSPNMSVTQNVKYENLNKNIVDALRLLNIFNVKAENPDWKSAIIKITPDKDAIVRARVQNSKTDNPQELIHSRASVDVLLQSAFMQLGSQNTYNSLTDKRYGSLNSKDTGLTEFEKTFVESVVNNDGEKTSVVYQNVDGDILKGYFHSPEVVKKNITDTLNSNKNVIVGITETDENNRIIGGHEITIIGSKVRKGELYFVCNDTDDDFVGSVEVKASDLIPKIHHAGIPVNILGEQNEPDKNKELFKQLNGTKEAA